MTTPHLRVLDATPRPITPTFDEPDPPRSQADVERDIDTLLQLTGYPSVRAMVDAVADGDSIGLRSCDERRYSWQHSEFGHTEAPKQTDPIERAYVLQATIDGLTPRTWRRVEVRGDLLIGDLAGVVQAAFQPAVALPAGTLSIVQRGLRGQGGDDATAGADDPVGPLLDWQFKATYHSRAGWCATVRVETQRAIEGHEPLSFCAGGRRELLLRADAPLAASDEIEFDQANVNASLRRVRNDKDAESERAALELTSPAPDVLSELRERLEGFERTRLDELVDAAKSHHAGWHLGDATSATRPLQVLLDLTATGLAATSYCGTVTRKVAVQVAETIGLPLRENGTPDPQAIRALVATAERADLITRSERKRLCSTLLGRALDGQPMGIHQALVNRLVPASAARVRSWSRDVDVEELEYRQKSEDQFIRGVTALALLHVAAGAPDGRDTLATITRLVNNFPRSWCYGHDRNRVREVINQHLVPSLAWASGTYRGFDWAFVTAEQRSLAAAALFPAPGRAPLPTAP